jgi:[ribosomal protein S5]-alanine N-acetyltransferase
MVALETERLALRNFKFSDWEDLHAMIVQYKASAYAKYDQPWPTSPEEIQGVINWFASGDQFLAVCLKETRHFIGFVALNPETDEGSLVYNLGYVFKAEFHGKGYASEACRAVLAHAFRTLLAQSVVAGTAAVNHPSCRLLEKLGFQKTGESMGSLQNSADGKPIEFLGRTYTLTRGAWEKMGEEDRQGSKEFRGGYDTK